MTSAPSDDPPPDRSPKPLRADARRNRQRVLDAARELFASEGLGVPLDAIALRAGVGAGTVHRHFPAKEALIAAIVVADLEQRVEEARTLAGAEDPGGALFGLLERMLDEGLASKALKDALTGTDFSLRTAAPDTQQALHDALRVLLTAAQYAGAIRPDIDVADLMALLAGAFAVQQHPAVGSKRALHLRAVFLDGLRTGHTV